MNESVWILHIFVHYVLRDLGRDEGGGGGSAVRAHARVLVGKKPSLTLLKSSQKWCHPFFKECPVGGNKVSSLQPDARYGMAAFLNPPVACTIPFPVLVSLPHKSFVSLNLLTDSESLFLHSDMFGLSVHAQMQSVMHIHKSREKSLLPTLTTVNASSYGFAIITTQHPITSEET